MGESAKRQEYFEAIIQLRNPNDELIRFIHNQVNKRGNVFISREVKQDNGVDYYISDQRFARALGNRMRKGFRGELKTSRKLHTKNRQTSRDVYRVTVCFRMS